ncbi:MAG: VWA domain-containing protein [Chloroflexi bacterium]|nr:VWA domain-containing protein [Chloroflexota bacterium]
MSVYRSESASAAASGTLVSPTAHENDSCDGSSGGNAYGTGYVSCDDGESVTYKDFNYAVPVGATITGIKVQLVQSTKDKNETDGVYVAVHNGTSFSSNRLFETNTEGTPPGDSDDSGGSSDPWGLSWNVAGANAIKVRVTGKTAGGGSQKAYFDNVQVAVYYTLPPVDTDGDGVSDTKDLCLATASGEQVNSSGCSLNDYIKQLNTGTGNANPNPKVCSEANFSFVVDKSGSVDSTEMGQMRTGILAFKNAYELGGVGSYRLTTFAGSSAGLVGTGYTNAATFDTNVTSAVSGSGSGATPTALGITTGNVLNGGDPDQHIMFVVTDGGPNVPDSGLGTSDPVRWVNASNDAITAANTARTNSFIVNAIWIASSDGTMPFDGMFGAGSNNAFSQAVMNQIGGGSSYTTSFSSIATDLLKASGCDPSIQKSDGTVDAVAGTVTWTVTINNLNAVAKTFTVADAGATLTGSSGCSVAPTPGAGPWTCTVAGNGNATLTLTTPLPQGFTTCQGGSGENTAYLYDGSSATGNPLGNDKGTWSHPGGVGCVTDPTISKEKASEGVTGGYAYWDVKVNNSANPNDAVGVFVKDDATLVSVSGGSCAASAGASLASGTSCTVTAGATLVVKVKKEAPTAQCLPQYINNSASVWRGTSDSGDPISPSPVGNTEATKYTIAGNASKCGQPSITKKLVNGGTEPVTVTDPNDIAWTVVVTNPATLPGATQTVVIQDSNVIVTSGPSFTNGADCTPNNATGDFQTALTGSGVSCTMPGGASVQSTITFTVKPSGTVARECQDKPFNNTASIQIGDADPINAVGPTITLQGDRTKCDAQLRVKKVVTNVVDDPTGFSGKITLNNVDVAGATFSGLTETDADGILFTLPQGSVYRAVETPQLGYTLLGYAKGNWDTLACPANPDPNYAGETLDTTDIAPGGDLICIYNEKSTRDLEICKVVVGNGDGITMGGEFKFTAGGKDVAITANEPASDLTDGTLGVEVCKKVEVSTGTVTVFEWNSPARPANWNGDDPLFPQNSVYGFGSMKETANVPGDVNKVVFRNKTLPKKVDVKFRKYVCNSLGDVAANQGGTASPNDVGKLSMSATGGLGAQLNQTAAPSGSNDPVTPNNDGNNETNCHIWGSDQVTYPEETGDWNFFLKSKNGASTLATIPHTAGTTETTYTLTGSQLALALKADTLRVEEEYKTGYGFASIKCYRDHQNQDNWEWLDFSGGLPTGDVWCIAYNVKADKEIVIEKRFIGAESWGEGDIPTFTFTNPSIDPVCKAVLNASSDHVYIVCTVPYDWNGTVTETPPAGWEDVTKTELCRGAQEPSFTSDAGALVQAETLKPDFLFCNRPVGTVVVVKYENVPPATTQTWNFNGTLPGAPVALQTTGTTNATGTASTTLTNVPAGSYTLAELQGRGQCESGTTSSDYQTRGLTSSSLPSATDVNGAPIIGANDLNVTVQKGATTYVAFGNQGCGTVLSAANLQVFKYSDPAANFTGTTELGGWTISITGTAGAATGFNASEDTVLGTGAFFLGIPDGTYTVCETAKTNWAVVGSKYNATNQAGVCRTGVVVALDQTVVVNFYNQPRVNIEVNKTEISLATPSGAPGNGWNFTLSGCGVGPLSQATAANGKATFTDLPPAVGCSYTVTETVKSGWSAINPVQVTAPATAGQTSVLNFTNVKIEVCINCTPTTTTPTPTPETPTPEKPTPTATATPEKPTDPTATPTEEPTEKPTEDIVSGEKTPGPGQTPLAPSAGNGLMGGGAGGVNMLMALVGLLALSLGSTILAIGRKSSRR